MKKLKLFFRWLYAMIFCKVFAFFGNREYQNLQEAIIDQEKVMDEYQKSGAVLDSHDKECLHMFFSPMRVPRGLTKEMVRVCIILYPKRRRQVELQRQLNGELSPVLRPMILPTEFSFGKKITEKSFAIGISKFLLSLAEMENMAIEIENYEKRESGDDANIVLGAT